MKQLNHLVSELHSNSPSIPFAPGLSLESFADEDDPKPFFVQLPLVEVGKTSANGLTWDASAARNLVEQINSKRPEGILGHVPKEQRHFSYKLPSLRWVGATIAGNTVWGKAYIPPDKLELRAYLQQSMKLSARVGTSVYGTSKGRGLAGFNLESIDLGHPDRVSSPVSAAVPQVVSEFEQAGISVQEPPLIANQKGDVEMEFPNLYGHSIKGLKDRALRKLVSGDQQAPAPAFDSDLSLADVRIVIAKLREEVVAGEQKLVKITDVITRAVLNNKSTHKQEDERQQLQTRVADVKLAIERLVSEQQVAAAREDLQRYEAALAALPKLLANQEAKHEAAKEALRDLRAAVQTTGDAFNTIGTIGRRNGKKNPLEVERESFEDARIRLPDDAFMN